MQRASHFINPSTPEKSFFYNSFCEKQNESTLDPSRQPLAWIHKHFLAYTTSPTTSILSTNHLHLHPLNPSHLPSLTPIRHLRDIRHPLDTKLRTTVCMMVSNPKTHGAQRWGLETPTPPLATLAQPPSRVGGRTQVGPSQPRSDSLQTDSHIKKTRSFRIGQSPG